MTLTRVFRQRRRFHHPTYMSLMSEADSYKAMETKCIAEGNLRLAAEYNRCAWLLRLQATDMLPPDSGPSEGDYAVAWLAAILFIIGGAVLLWLKFHH